MRNASGHQCKVKMNGKSEREHVRRKFHVVVVQNNGKEMYKRLCSTCKVAILLIRPIVFFTVLRRCLRRLALDDFIFCLNKL